MDFGILNLSWDDYHSLDAISASRLNAFNRSPAACRHSIDNPGPQTGAMRIGSAVHLRTLEPGRFSRTYAPKRYDGRTKAGKEEREAAEAQGLELLSLEEFEAVEAMADSLTSHPRVSGLLSIAKDIEQTAVWEIRDGVLGKARRDVVGDQWIAEVKTTASLGRFSPWVITDLGYHRQAAWYTQADVELGRPVSQNFFFLVVATSPPYESAVFRLDEESLELGRQEIDALLPRYLDCLASGEWSRHVPQILTARAVKRLED